MVVLVVDEKPYVGQLIEKQLAGTGLEMFSVESLDQAVSFLRSNRCRELSAIVVGDVPVYSQLGYSQFGFIRLARKELGQDVPIIAMSFLGSSSLFRDAGCSHWAHKNKVADLIKTLTATAVR